MLKRDYKIGFVLLVALATFGANASARAQREVPRPKAERAPAVQQPKPLPQERAMLGLPNGWVERLQAMTPQQQERFFNNKARFRELPPERQEQIRRRLQAVNNMTPEQRQAFDQREQVWGQMPPDQQRYVRDTLLPQWKNLAPVRRQLLLQKLRNLRGLDDAQRNAKLNDEAFLNGLDPSERNMLRDLSNLRVGSPDAAGYTAP